MSINYRLKKIEEIFNKEVRKKLTLSVEKIKMHRTALKHFFGILLTPESKEYVQIRDLVLKYEGRKFTAKEFDEMFFREWNFDRRVDFVFEYFFDDVLPPDYEYKVLTKNNSP